jgi:hypothetical protein
MTQTKHIYGKEIFEQADSTVEISDENFVGLAQIEGRAYYIIKIAEDQYYVQRVKGSNGWPLGYAEQVIIKLCQYLSWSRINYDIIKNALAIRDYVIKHQVDLDEWGNGGDAPRYPNINTAS